MTGQQCADRKVFLVHIADDDVDKFAREIEGLPQRWCTRVSYENHEQHEHLVFQRMHITILVLRTSFCLRDGTDMRELPDVRGGRGLESLNSKPLNLRSRW